MLHLEDKEQMAVIEWAAYRPHIGYFLIAIPNGAKRSPKAGNKEKRMGLKKGVSDLFLARAENGKHGLWIEMKKQRQHFRGIAEQESAVSPEQAAWQIDMIKMGYAAVIAYGADEAIKAIEDYMSNA